MLKAPENYYAPLTAQNKHLDCQNSSHKKVTSYNTLDFWEEGFTAKYSNGWVPYLIFSYEKIQCNRYEKNIYLPSIAPKSPIRPYIPGIEFDSLACIIAFKIDP